MQMKKPPAGGLFYGPTGRSAFGELFAAPRLVQADFLALDFARIPRYEARFFENRLKRCVILDQRPRDAVTDSARLPRLAAAIDVDHDIERIELVREDQRLAHDHAARFARKKHVDGFLVHDDVAFTRLDENTRDRAFPAAGAIVVLRLLDS